MSEQLETLRKDLQEEIDLRNEAHGETSNMSLFGVYYDILSSSGQVIDEDLSIIDSRISGIHIAATCRDIERSEIHVFTTDYYPAFSFEKIYKSDVERIVDELVVASYKVPEETKEKFDSGDPIREFLDDLSLRLGNWSRLVIWLASNRLFSSRDGSSGNLSKGGLEIVFNCVDLKYYHSLITDRQVSEINISCNLPAVKVVQNDTYSSYLFAISGLELCKYYDQYGKRLLESNVRTFLSLRGNVNKGIYNTIHLNSERLFFFAYNNGLTATASDIEYSNSRITLLKDLQIVNGGQTMSTVYKAWKDGKSLDEVYIQVKLSVIHDLENKDLFVSKISRFANTQNPVSNSDFFSNSYYHKRVKELSREVRVSVQGQITPERWFYERVRGEYQNEQIFLNHTERIKFRKQFPASKTIDKIALAKAYLSVNEFPYLVSRGAQLCFAEFAKRVADLYDEEENILDEGNFKILISHVVLFRSFEKEVSNSGWYSGGYRAQTVAYTIAFYCFKLKEVGMVINWGSIWNAQAVSEFIISELLRFGKLVHEKLINPPPGNTNIGTYSKKEPCWQNVKSLSIVPDKGIVGLRYIDKSAGVKVTSDTQTRRGAHPDKGIAAVMKVVELAKTGTPKKLFEFYNSSYAPGIKDRDRSILSNWSLGKIGVPSEIQATIIIKALKRAEESGF